ncbi:MAG: 3-deoxy-D-manno-octulosonic acid transferase [Rhodobacteraceae bacterium]|nr:3-deoxy-D-manno-octulosonic acid transferase [Paracoccaceae bacterium]
MAERPLLVTLYLLLARVCTPVYHLLHLSRLRGGKDDPTRRGERFGKASVARPQGKLIWVHAASVGETNSILPLIESLVARGLPVLLTTVTRTSAEIAEKRLPDGALHQYACFDHPSYWKRFLDHWRPALSIMVESEIWPACFEALKMAGCPICLVNGRMSDRSFRNWSKLGKNAHHVFGSINLALAQSPADAERLAKLGCKHVEQPGNLKFDAVPARADRSAVEALRQAIAERPIWLAALTHPGEDEIAVQAHAALLKANPDLLLILVPRHPARFDTVERLVEEAGFKSQCRSRDHLPDASAQVFIGDTLGEMSIYYDVSKVVFLAGSFALVGGHNPVEAASFDCAIVTGPKVANARTIYRTLWDEEVTLRLDDPQELHAMIGGLLDDPERCERYAQRAKQFIETERGALDRSLALLAPYLSSEK